MDKLTDERLHIFFELVKKDFSFLEDLGYTHDGLRRSLEKDGKTILFTSHVNILFSRTTKSRRLFSKSAREDNILFQLSESDGFSTRRFKKGEISLWVDLRTELKNNTTEENIFSFDIASYLAYQPLQRPLLRQDVDPYCMRVSDVDFEKDLTQHLLKIKTLLQDDLKKVVNGEKNLTIPFTDWREQFDFPD